MKMLILLLFMIPFAHAQHPDQPGKESSKDLRSHTLLFSIEIPGDDASFRLERDAAESYKLRHQQKQAEQLSKLSSPEALRLEQEFVSRFLRYEFGSVEAVGECEVALRLNLKGERREICKKDEQESREIHSFLKELAKRF